MTAQLRGQSGENTSSVEDLFSQTDHLNHPKTTCFRPDPPVRNKLFAKAIVYLKINCNLDFPNIASRLVPDAMPESLEHDCENVYEWMWLNIKDVPFALNVSREHGWADIDDEIQSTATEEKLKALVKPGAVYLSGWDRSSDSYVSELPEWFPQFVADQLLADVFVYNGRINVEIPDGEPVAVVPPQPGNANNHAVNGSRR